MPSLDLPGLEQIQPPTNRVFPSAGGGEAGYVVRRRVMVSTMETGANGVWNHQCKT